MKSSDPAIKIHQHYLNISETFGLFRKSYIGIYGLDIEIPVSEFTRVSYDLKSFRRPNVEKLEDLLTQDLVR